MSHEISQAASPEPFGTAEVQAALDATGWGIQVRFFEQSTATSQMAADAIGTSLGSIAKSIVFLVEGLPNDQPDGQGQSQAVLVVTAGDKKVDDRKIAAHYGIPRKKIRTAKAEECIARVGYAPGGVPPIGHRHPLPIFIDASLQRFEKIYAAAGSANTIFPLTFAQLQAITAGTVLDVAKEEVAE